MALLDDLPESARKAYPVIVGGVRRGLSNAKIADIVRNEKGLAISDAALRTVANQERAIYGAGERLKFLNLTQTPNPDRLPVALVELQRRYSFTVRVRGTDPNSGAPLERHVTISTDTLMTRQELQDQALDIVESAADRYGSGYDEPLLMGGVKAGAKGIL